MAALSGIKYNAFSSHSLHFSLSVIVPLTSHPFPLPEALPAIVPEVVVS